MRIYPLTVFGGIETNTYFYIDETSRHGFLIDPAAEPEKLLKLIKDHHWVIEKMLITHGHCDHIGAVEQLHQILKIPYYIHIKGKKYLTDPSWNLSAYFGKNIILNEAVYFNDNDTFSLETDSDITLSVIHTAGHTEDSVIFYDKHNMLAFVGDTIFKGSIGRTDFPGGNAQHLKQSIENKILTLPDQTILYSGHSESTTVKAEKNNFHYFF